MARSRIAPEDSRPESKGRGNPYWEDSPLRFFGSGCTLLDCALGGGWALSRTVNIVGDKSTGKTQLAIEACANFAASVPKGLIEYIETEAAFDVPYAETIGLPVSRVRFTNEDGKINTVEALHGVLEAIADRPQPTLAVVDSLDALSDAAEMAREFGESTYGQGKAKGMSEVYRRLNQKLSRSGSCVMFLSQVRDAIGVSFGKKETRAGGRWLDFYCAQVLWLYPRKKVEQERKGVKRVVGVRTLARVEKNKVGRPWREAEFPILFEYGVEDVVAAIDWLEDIKREDVLGEKPDAYLRRLRSLGDQEYAEERRKLNELVKTLWADIEAGFAPPRRKYLVEPGS